MFSLAGKKALVVGIANDQSIAWGVAQALHRGGAQVAVTYLNAKAEPHVRPLAEPFVRWLGLSLLLDAWNASLAAVLRSHLRSRDTLAVIVAMHSSHLLLCVPLMLGAGPLPPLGLSGFALALLASRGLGVVLHLALWRARLGLVPQAADWWRLPRAELAAVLHIGLPGAAENIAWRLAFMASLAVVGQLGTAALATHAYVMQVMMGVLLFGAATGIAVEIVVGHLVGAGRLREADRLLRRALAADRAEAQRRIADLKQANAPQREIQAAERSLAQLPKNEAAAAAWVRRSKAAWVLPLLGGPTYSVTLRLSWRASGKVSG